MENTKANTITADDEQDHFEGVWYAKYSFGPVSIGYSESYLENGTAEHMIQQKLLLLLKQLEQLLVSLNLNRSQLRLT